jgi:hypothetical protein
MPRCPAASRARRGHRGRSAARRRAVVPLNARSETPVLADRVENDVAAAAQNLVKLLIAKSRRVDMHLPAHLLAAEPRLEERAGGDSGQIFGDHRKNGMHGKAFEGQQYFTAGALLHGLQQLQIPTQQTRVENVHGGSEGLQPIYVVGIHSV